MKHVGMALGLFFWAVTAQASLSLTPQDVVDRVLSEGREAESVLYQARRSELALAKARAVYDVGLQAETGYELDRAEALTGLDNIEDRTWTYRLGLGKKFITGTQLGVRLQRTRQNSILNTFTQQTRPEDVTQDVATLEFEQPLLGNFFGRRDRLNVLAAETGVQIAGLKKDEDLENVVLDALHIYWDAYVARETMREAIAARDKYRDLVGVVQTKARYNFVTPGELARVKAEAEQQDQRVKRASAEYLRLVNRLLRTARLETTEDIDFKVESLLPAMPELPKSEPEALREMRAAKLEVERANLEANRAWWDSVPNLSLVARAGVAGLERSSGEALAEAVSGRRPVYFVGLKFETWLGSNGPKGELNDKRIGVLQSENQLAQARDRVRDGESDLFKLVSAYHDIAKSAIETVNLRAQLVREQERSFRQGRFELSELVRSFNEYFQAESQRTRAVGNYHMALNELAAARDELIRRYKAQ